MGYLYGLGPYERTKVLCYMNDETQVLADLVGHVDTHIVDDDNGVCEIVIGGRIMQGYILGSIRGTGTTVVLGEDDQLFVYTPETAMDPPWANMASVAANFEFDATKTTLKILTEMVVVSVGDW